MPPIKAKYTIIKSVFASLLTLVIFFSQAQNGSNYMQVTTNSPNFNLNTATALETQQTRTKAVTLAIRSSSSAYSVYVRVINFNYPAGSSLDDFALAIKLNSLSVSSSYTANYDALYLSLNDQRIAQASRHSSTGYWYYDLILNPVGYDSAPGNYSATLLFTMTQP